MSVGLNNCSCDSNFVTLLKELQNCHIQALLDQPTGEKVSETSVGFTLSLHLTALYLMCVALVPGLW